MRIDLEGRVFFVSFSSKGEPKGIRERRIYAKGSPYEALYDAPYWHHSQKRPARGLVARILAKAEDERQKELRMYR